MATTLTNLGIAYGDLDDAQKKRDLLEKALRIKEREYGPEHQTVAITLDNLDSAYGDLGDTRRMNKMNNVTEYEVKKMNKLKMKNKMQSSAKQVTFALATAGCLSTIHEGRLE